MFILNLSKWFGKKWVSFILPLFLSYNSVIYVSKNIIPKEYKKVISLTSAIVLFIIIVLILLFLPTDPMDHGLIINETAIYLSSWHTSNMRDIMTIEEFKEEFMKREKFESLEEK